jgi:hypothetical protein
MMKRVAASATLAGGTGRRGARLALTRTDHAGTAPRNTQGLRQSAIQAHTGGVVVVPEVRVEPLAYLLAGQERPWLGCTDA